MRLQRFVLQFGVVGVVRGAFTRVAFVTVVITHRSSFLVIGSLGNRRHRLGTCVSNVRSDGKCGSTLEEDVSPNTVLGHHGHRHSLSALETCLVSRVFEEGVSWAVGSELWVEFGRVKRCVHMFGLPCCLVLRRVVSCSTVTNCLGCDLVYVRSSSDDCGESRWCALLMMRFVPLRRSLSFLIR